jgi:uncharacterized protein YbjQ (UPF0145 family)
LENIPSEAVGVGSAIAIDASVKSSVLPKFSPNPPNNSSRHIDMSSSKPKDASKRSTESQPMEFHSFSDTHGIITTTMNDLPGYRIVGVLGTVYGLTVRSRNWGADIGAFLKSSVGGELKYLTSMLYSARNSAVERMVGECQGRGGNAIIAMRFDQGEIKIWAQVCAYGTAVVVEPIEEETRGYGRGSSGKARFDPVKVYSDY